MHLRLGWASGLLSLAERHLGLVGADVLPPNVARHLEGLLALVLQGSTDLSQQKNTQIISSIMRPR